MDFDCVYCQKTFSTKSNLVAHQKSAKYCLEKQGKDDDGKFDCEFCKKKFRVKQTLVDHYYSCKEKNKKDYAKTYEDENKILKEKLEELKNELEKQKREYEAKLEKFENAFISVATEPKKSTTSITYNNSQVSNNNNNNFLNLSPEVLEPLLREKLTFDVVKQGQKALASVVYDNVLKANGELKYRCSDTSRQNFEFTDKNGNIEKDFRAKKLTKALIDSKVEKIAGDIGSKEWAENDEMYERFHQKVSEIVTLSVDDRIFRTELTSLTS